MQIHDISFAFVTFVNGVSPYPQIMEVCLMSHRLFSKVPLILYTHGIDKSEFTECGSNVIHVPIDPTIELHNVFYFKPYVIRDAIQKGLKSGFYIEADDILTPAADSIQDYCSRITTMPLSPKHPSPVKVSDEYMRNLRVFEQTQDYVHGHVLFTASTLPFIEEWFDACMKSTGDSWDEAALNCILWKHGAKDHFMPYIDPWHGYYPVEGALLYDGCKSTIQGLRLVNMILNTVQK